MIVNGYGPTENTVYTTCHALYADREIEDPIPIGEPILGTIIEIREYDSPQTRTGKVGELLVGGVGLAHGYFNNKGLTDRSFLTGGHSGETVKLYRTGDIVRMDDRGRLYFLGRVDNQIKLRGYRIELEEIEQCLNEFPGVAASAVTLHGSATYNRYLVAHVSFSRESALCLESIREKLRAKLPDYMIPSVFTTIDALPLTDNGKVDRRKLLSQYEVQGRRVSRQSAASVPGFENVLESWRRHLNTPTLEWLDDVYEHGASSLTRVGVQVEVDRLFECQVPMVDFSFARTPFDWAKVYEAHLLHLSQS